VNQSEKVRWGDTDACRIYDDVLRVFQSSRITIHVKRSSDNAVWYLLPTPKDGKELSEAVQATCHGKRAESEYAITFRDAATRVERGRGLLTLPSTLDEKEATP